VPDGRIFGQITQKRPQKIVHGRKKLEAGKWLNLAKSGRKEAGKYFDKYSGEKHMIFCNFSDFHDFFGSKRCLKPLFYTAFVKWQNFFQIFRLLWPCSKKGKPAYIHIPRLKKEITPWDKKLAGKP
jgi:hypothetical protein